MGRQTETPVEPVRVPTGNRWPTHNSITQRGSICREPYTKSVGLQRYTNGSTRDCSLGHLTPKPKGVRGKDRVLTGRHTHSSHLWAQDEGRVGDLPNHMSKYLKVITQTNKRLNEIYSIC